MATFNRRRCLDNIYTLAKQQGKKIGDLESAAGVSSGYLSRAIKDDSTSKITAELIAILADILGVSIDLLVWFDLSELSVNEKRVLNFLQKIQKDTLYGNIFWDKYPEVKPAELHRYSGGATSNILFSYTKANQLPYYNSYFNRGAVTQIGDYFAADIPHTDGRLFLVRVRTEDTPDTDYYELYIGSFDGVNQEYGIEPLCGSSQNSSSEFDEILRGLYENVSDSCKNIKLSPYVATVMDRYLTPMVDDDSGDLPF